MRTSRSPVTSVFARGLFGIALALAAAQATAQTDDAEAKPAYLDTDLGFQQRAADLVSRMTLQEKVAQMQNSAPAIPRLGVPAYDWWSEGLHGVARAGQATVFPQAIGLSATFDVPLMYAVATAISDEARAKHDRFVREGRRGRYQGLTFWSPNINIFRDPRWGRGQETYGEDPFLTARMGVAFVEGLQGNDPHYRKLDATAKHFAVHSGPESERHRFDVRPGERDLFETYLPAFRALVREAHVDALMGAYNRVDGVPATANPRLLGTLLRKRWGFTGYVVSDCDAVADIYQHHKVAASAEQAAAMAVKAGDDLNCGTTYSALVKAVHDGLVDERTIDRAVTRLMRARMRLGMFDPPAQVPWSRLPYSVNQSPAHDALARRAASESIVLLKNDGVLPLSRLTKRLAVIGPTADDVDALLGNYHGTPAHPVTILDGIRKALPHTRVTYVHGANLVEGRIDPDALPRISARYLRPAPGARTHGLRGEYFRGRDFKGSPVLTRVDPHIDFRWHRSSPTDFLPAQPASSADHALPADDFSVRWSGQLLAPESGRYEFEVAADDGFRLYVDGKLVLDRWSDVQRMRGHTVHLALKAGHSYSIRLEYYEDQYNAGVRLGWRLPSAKSPMQAALDAARNADAVIFVGGLTSAVEGEEMDVDYPGFQGGDRTRLALPASQRALLKALQATGKPVVLVLTSGSALAIDWAQRHLPGILLAWYPGQRGGDAVADVLFGNADPAGRLPITFYRSVKQLPPFDDYAMKGRTYCYFRGTPLYPFGYGLSYTRFAYSDLHLDRTRVDPAGTLNVSLKVKNTGARAGDEVVQLYLRAFDTPYARALKNLRGFQRIHLAPGEERTVTFRIEPSRDLSYYSVKKRNYAVAPGSYEAQVGASSTDIRLHQRFVVGQP